MFCSQLRSTVVALSVAWLLGACQSQPSTNTQSSATALTRIIPKQQVLDDLTLFQRIKESAHAGIYKYRTKAQMDSAFAAVRAQVTDQMTVLDMYKLVMSVTDFEGSLHNNAFLPDTVRNMMHAEPVFFPYPVKLISGKMVLNSTQAPIPLGATISSVNGIPALQLVRELGKYYTTDGLNTTGKTVGLAASFPEYYRLEYGPATEFAVCYTVPTSSDTLTQTLPAVAYRAYVEDFQARHSKPSDHGFFAPAKQQYTFRLLPHQPTAVLTLNTFTIGDDSTVGHKKYKAFLDSCFLLLRRSPAVINLLVDVRANGGGDDDNDMVAFSYLASVPFRENKASTVSFTRVPCHQYLSFEKDTTERADLVQEIEQELRTDFNLGTDGKLHENAKVNPVFQPKQHRFRGNLYLLISPRIASAGSMFAAMVRGNTNAVVIGEETMGGYYGHTGHTPVEYRLPNSGIQISFSIVDLVQDVPIKAVQPPGRGVMPDYPVTQSVADFLANHDTQMEFALQLIVDKTSGTK